VQVQAIVHVSGRACFQLRSEVVPVVVMMKRTARSWTFENAAKTKTQEMAILLAIFPIFSSRRGSRVVVEEIMLALARPKLKFKAARQASAFFFSMQPSKFQMQVRIKATTKSPTEDKSSEPILRKRFIKTLVQVNMVPTAPKHLNFITGNVNKLVEVRAILGDTIELRSQSLDLLEIQGTVEEVSIDKCRRAAETVCLVIFFTFVFKFKY